MTGFIFCVAAVIILVFVIGGLLWGLLLLAFLGAIIFGLFWWEKECRIRQWRK